MRASKTEDKTHTIALSSGLGSVELVFNDDDIIRLLRAAVEQEGSQTLFAKRYGLNAGAIIPHCSDRVTRLRRSKNPAADSLLPSIRQRARDEGRGSLFEGAACGSN